MDGLIARFHLLSLGEIFMLPMTALKLHMACKHVEAAGFVMAGDSDLFTLSLHALIGKIIP